MLRPYLVSRPFPARLFDPPVSEIRHGDDHREVGQVDDVAMPWLGSKQIEMLSVNLAVLNILPIPVLDGGHLVFLAIEAVRGRPVSLEQRIRLTKVGMAVIIALMAFALGNDIVRWIGF